MKRTPNGKISRLPQHIREQIQSRLRDRMPGAQILSWLNSLPEVNQVLSALFGGRPIDDGNLSEWKTRHHQTWLNEQAALAQTDHFMAEARQLAQAGQGAISDHLAVFVASRFAVAVRQLPDDAPESEHWKLLRTLCHDVAALRQGDHRAEHLRLQRKRLEMLSPGAFFPMRPKT